MKNIGFIYKNKCHPVTQAFANKINATPHKITGPIHAITTAFKIPDYNYYFIESVMSMITPMTKRLLGKKCIIVFRGNDELFANTEAYLKSPNPIKRLLLRFLISHMDAISVESQKQIAEIQQHTNVPVEVAISFIETKETLKKIHPDTNTNNFLFIGAYRPPYDHKGIQHLIETFRNLPECKLTIIGKNTNQLKKYATENITILDFVDKLQPYWENATFYIQLPKYEAGPITLLEAMTAGLIPITNSNAGHANSVEEIDKNLVLSSQETPETAAEKLKKIIGMPNQTRRKLSETFKKKATTLYSREEMTTKFQQSWNRLTTNEKTQRRMR